MEAATPTRQQVSKSVICFVTSFLITAIIIRKLLHFFHSLKLFDSFLKCIKLPKDRFHRRRQRQNEDSALISPTAAFTIPLTRVPNPRVLAQALA